MPQKPNNLKERIDHLFRYEYGKPVSVLTKTFGSTNIGLAENVVQVKGHLGNPVDWTYKVAKYKAVIIINREMYKTKYASDITQQLQSEWTVEPELNHIFI